MNPKARNRPFDEMTLDDGETRAAYRFYEAWLRATPLERFARKHDQADMLFRRLGITFTVYGEEEGTERLIPFDIIPRILGAEEWNVVATGVCQRVDAINAFLHGVCHDQDILKAGRIPPELVLTNDAYRPEMLGLDLPGGVSVHVAGIDVVRVRADEFYVLEDNVHTPSGVSYMLKNRMIMMRLFDDLGWVSFDAANGQSATDAYVRLAIGFDYADAGPIRGLRRRGGEERLKVRVQVDQRQE